MTLPAMPAQGAPWYTYAQALDAAARNAVPKWKPSTAYTAGDPVVNPSGQLVTANATFTSGTTYSAANWTVTGGSGGSGGGSPSVTTVAASGTTQTLTLPASTDITYDVTLTGNCTLTLTGGTAGKLGTITVILRQDATAGRTVTFPFSVAWPGQTPPTLNLGAGKYDVLQFATLDGGTTWIGSLIASAVQPFTAPLAPTTTLATAASGTLSVSATDGGNGGSPITGHNVYRSTTAGAETLLASAVALPYADSGLTNGSPYYYKVSATNAVGESALTAEFAGTPGHYLNQPSTGNASTPDATALRPTAGQVVSLRGLVQMANWVPSGNSFIVAKWGASGSQAYALYIDNAGKLNALYVTGSFQGSASTVALAVPPNGQMWVRADISQTAGTITYYTSNDGTTWTQLGAVIATTAGTITAGTTPPPVTVGASAVPNSFFVGRIFRAQIIIAGSTVFDANFLTATAGATSFTDTAGNTITINSPAAIS